MLVGLRRDSSNICGSKSWLEVPKKKQLFSHSLKRLQAAGEIIHARLNENQRDINEVDDSSRNSNNPPSQNHEEADRVQISQPESSQVQALSQLRLFLPPANEIKGNEQSSNQQDPKNEDNRSFRSLNQIIDYEVSSSSVFSSSKQDLSPLIKQFSVPEIPQIIMG